MIFLVNRRKPPIVFFCIHSFIHSLLHSFRPQSIPSKHLDSQQNDTHVCFSTVFIHLSIYSSIHSGPSPVYSIETFEWESKERHTRLLLLIHSVFICCIYLFIHSCMYPFIQAPVYTIKTLERESTEGNPRLLFFCIHSFIHSCRHPFIYYYIHSGHSLYHRNI